MKAIVVGILIVLALHVVAAAGFVGWLHTSGRLNEQRVKQVVDIFRITIEEQAQKEAEAAALAEQTHKVAEHAARLEAVADGPRTMQDRLASELQADELAMHRFERMQRETEDLRSQIERAKTLISKQKAELQAQRADFEAFVKKQTDLQRDEDFQQAVQMYEQLRPKQVKEMFQQLLAQGQTEDVVQYLAAMQLRKAGKVLTEFKEGEEIAQATKLVELLKERGVYPLADAIVGRGNAQ